MADKKVKQGDKVVASVTKSNKLVQQEQKKKKKKNEPDRPQPARLLPPVRNVYVLGC